MRSNDTMRHGAGSGATQATSDDDDLRLADEALAHRVEEMLSKGRWQQCCTIGVTVRDAIVTLDGTCSDDICLQTIEQAVRGVDSVRDVEAHLYWAMADCGIGVALR